MPFLREDFNRVKYQQDTNDPPLQTEGTEKTFTDEELIIFIIE